MFTPYTYMITMDATLFYVIHCSLVTEDNIKHG